MVVMQGIIIQMQYECELMRTDQSLLYRLKKRLCPRGGVQGCLLCGKWCRCLLAVAFHITFNMFSSNSKQIWHVNKFTSAFLQSQNYKVKQSQK